MSGGGYRPVPSDRDKTGPAEVRRRRQPERLISRHGPGIGSLEVRWRPHEELATTALVTFESHSTVRPGDDDTAVILNAFTETLSDLIEAFSNEVGSEIAVVKESLLRKLRESAHDDGARSDDEMTDDGEPA